MSKLTKDVFKKGTQGELDDIYHLQGLFPQGTWRHLLDDDGEELPGSDEYVMLKTVIIETRVTVKA